MIRGALTDFAQTCTHNAVHEIQDITKGSEAPIAIAHDAKGNMTRDEQGNTYAWDYDNQLTAVHDANGTLLAREVVPKSRTAG